MAQGSVQTDIETGMPVDHSKKEKDAKNKSILESKTRLSNISKSEPGSIIVGMIHDLLFKKIKKIIDEDPECKAYNEMLLALGNQEITAKIAVDKLIKLKLRDYDKDIKEPAV